MMKRYCRAGIPACRWFILISVLCPLLSSPAGLAPQQARPTGTGVWHSTSGVPDTATKADGADGGTAGGSGDTIQIKRGTTAQRNSVTPANGEMIWDTDQILLYVGNGSTAGGVAVVPTSTIFVATKSGVNLLATGTTDIFTVPTGKTFVCTGAYFVLTTLTGTASATWAVGSMVINETSGTNLASQGVLATGNQVVGRESYMAPFATGASLAVPAGSVVRVNILGALTGWTTATATLYVAGFYF